MGSGGENRRQILNQPVQTILDIVYPIPINSLSAGQEYRISPPERARGLSEKSHTTIRSPPALENKPLAHLSRARLWVCTYSPAAMPSVALPISSP